MDPGLNFSKLLLKSIGVIMDKTLKKLRKGYFDPTLRGSYGKSAIFSADLSRNIETCQLFKL